MRWRWAGTNYSMLAWNLFCLPWKENSVPPFVVVEIVGVDLLRELGFVMILWPANTFITVQPSTKCWSMG